MASFFGFGTTTTTTPTPATGAMPANMNDEDIMSAQNTPHYHFIHSMLLPSTIQIQKDLRGRRYKAVQSKLSEAVMGMQSFQFQSWPLEKTAVVVELKDIVEEEQQQQKDDDVKDDDDDDDDDAVLVNSQDVVENQSTTVGTNDNTTKSTTTTTTTSLEEHLNANRPPSRLVATMSSTGTASEDGDSTTFELESTAGDFSKAPQEDDLRPFDDEVMTTAATTVTSSTTTGSTTTDTTTTTTAPPSPPVAAAATSATTTSTPPPPALAEDDPQTREVMHESIIHALEAYCLVMEHPSKTNKACEQALECITQLVLRGYVSGRAGGTDDKTASGSAANRTGATTTTTSTTSDNKPSLLHMLLTGIQKCSESNRDSVQSHVISCFKEIMVSPKCGVHEASMLMAIRSIFHIYLVTQSTTIQASAKQALMDMSTNIIERMELLSHQQQNNKKNPFYSDSYYLLRSLVKLSSKTLPGIDDNSATPTNFLAQQFLTTTTVDPLSLNNKVLSLELILQIMECAGDTFCGDEKFIHLVQGQLCVALLKNCMSNNTQVAFLSQRVFLILVYKFKTQLKDEIQVFMTNIFLRVLESENASYPQKALVLESLRSLCNDPELLTQIFLVYDCDFDAMNLYKDIVHHLTKLAAKSVMVAASEKYSSTSKTALAKKEQEEHAELSLASVEVLVTILQGFLTALDMPTTNSELNDTAGQKIRQTFALQDICGTPSRRVTKHRRDSLLTSTAVAAVSTTDAAAKELTVEDLERLTHEDRNGKNHTKSRSNSTDSTDLSMDHDNSINIMSTSSMQHSQQQQQQQSLSRQLMYHESSSDVAGKIVDAFHSKRNAEQNFELGAVKFTLSLKSGLNFFIDNHFVECSAKAMALFFLENKDKLDKTQMGEVLGGAPDAAFVKTPNTDPEVGGPGFFVRILNHYVDAMDFTGMLFDDAIRYFLSGFRLPGEAQKIDRIMEKFAEKYTQQNGEIFPSADTAFILAFSVIMLNTDLHNPSIKPERRMTMDGFKSNNRGIGENGSDLDPDFLEGIYKRIKEHPFSLKEDDAVRNKVANDAMNSSYFLGGDGFLGFGARNPEVRKKEKFKKERDEMMTATAQLIRQRKGKQTTVVVKSAADDIDPADVVKPMFDVTWGPIIGILSQVLECSEEERNIAVCLNGFVYAIRIAANIHLSLERDTFVNSLAKFTFLGSIKEMKYKNIEAIRTLMNIAIADGEYLGESWAPVLQCISQLARMRMSASGLDSDESFLKDKNKKGPATPTNAKSDLTKETEVMNNQAILASISEQLIDQVFASTVKLSAQSLGHFIRQLVAVSAAEIEGESKQNITGIAPSTTGSAHGTSEDGPSIFSLQRLVDVADFNMDVRPRLVWTQVWEIMAGFFGKIGCHRNSMVSFFAIDSLKQLSSKFLEKPELSEFHFQRIFLQPFLHIMENPASRQDIRELILECINQMVKSKAHNLQSGWKVFFDILMVSASDPNEKIMLLALNILQQMTDDHLEHLCRLANVDETAEEFSATEKRNRNSNADDFIGMCRTSLAFIRFEDSDNPRPSGVSIRALCHIAIYADLIADGRVLPPVSGAQSTDPDASCYTYEGLSEKEALEMALWRPMLEGLVKGVKSTCRSRAGGVGCLVQRGSVLAIRTILLRHGSLFSTNQLAAILRDTVLPAFQEAAESDQSPVVKITSESPAISGLDFLVPPLPLPPPRYDRGLLEFEEASRGSERAPTRPLGPAELLLEASFTDLRHGGDGDLTKAYKLAKKDAEQSAENEQPFPDSWVATTAPIALGCLTDISTEIVMQLGVADCEIVWPLIRDFMQRWCNGEVQVFDGVAVRSGWVPCEALVRIGCGEIGRFSKRLAEYVPRVEDKDAAAWWSNTCIRFFTSTLSNSLDMEQSMKSQVMEEKARVYKFSKGAGESDTAREGETKDDWKSLEETTLSWVRHVPVLKVRIIAAHFLNHGLTQMKHDSLVPFLEEDVTRSLLETLHRSRSIAEASVNNEDLALAFQETILSEWGENEDEMGEDALVAIARLSQTQGCAMFFLTQTAGATHAVIRLLGALYEFSGEPGSGDNNQWDRVSFAKPHLLEIMSDVLTKFIESEARDGHRIDPNVWRNAAESGVKVAFYCTSFASVVVGLLKTMLAFDESHFESHKAAFPMLCKLILVRSEEIRTLVQQIMLEKYAPLLGVQ